MIFIIGGAYQGKLDFAKTSFLDILNFGDLLYIQLEITSRHLSLWM